MGQSHPHGSIFSPKPCTACQCNNGHLNCTTKDPAKGTFKIRKPSRLVSKNGHFYLEDCPQLDCPLEEQTRDGEKCCQTCRGDFCSRGHDCHSELAVCVNGLLNYTCHCREGFKGNGTTCEGILKTLFSSLPHAMYPKLYSKYLWLISFFKLFRPKWMWAIGRPRWPLLHSSQLNLCQYLRIL